MKKKPVFREIIDQDQSVSFYRRLHEVPTADGMNLIMVHKKPLGRAKPLPVLLVHGLGQNRFTWSLSKRSLENYLVAGGFETFNLELRGHGLSRANGSDYPAHFEAYTHYDAPAAIEAVCRITGRDKLFYIGHSLGATISYCIGAPYQKSLAGIVSIAGPFQFTRGNRLLNSLARAGVALHKHLPFGLPYYPDAFYIDLIGYFAKYGLFALDHPRNKVPAQVWYPGSMEKDILEERIEKGFDRTSVQVVWFLFEWGAAGRFLSSDGKMDLSRRISDYTQPILFVVGDKDVAVTEASVREGFEKAGSADKVLKRFGGEAPGLHWGHIDLITGRRAPEFVWPYIMQWLDARGQAVSV